MFCAVNCRHTVLYWYWSCSPICSNRYDTLYHIRYALSYTVILHSGIPLDPRSGGLRRSQQQVWAHWWVSLSTAFRNYFPGDTYNTVLHLVAEPRKIKYAVFCLCSIDCSIFAPNTPSFASWTQRFASQRQTSCLLCRLVTTVTNSVFISKWSLFFCKLEKRSTNPTAQSKLQEG